MSDASQQRPSRPRRWPGVLLALLLVVGSIWGANQVLVARPVSGALTRDSRNRGYKLTAHYRYFLVPGALVLDLRQMDSAAPVDLLRGVFVAADTLTQLGRSFDRVILARAGTPVFVLNGKDFHQLGSEYRAGENPVYLIRTFPEKLYRYADGRQAYGGWEGGLLGVLTRQMQDVNDAVGAWVGGSPTSSFDSGFKGACGALRALVALAVGRGTVRAEQ